MKTAIGLIGLGVAGGVVPTGLAGIAQAGAVIGGTAAALALLVTVCLAAAVLTRRRSKAARVRPAVSVSRSSVRGI
jgi:hypothetical protein